jgi:hypothetical protein
VTSPNPVIRPTLTVDREQFIAWCSGTLLNIENGSGVMVNEQECSDANAALARGEPVLLRCGSRLLGRYIKYFGDELQEHAGHP